MASEYSEIRIPVPWGHIAGKAWGSTDNRPVLMLHGLMDNAGSFDRLLQYLPKNFYYVAIDLPGHGLSSTFPSGIPLQFYNFVYSIELVLNYFKWDKCICIGHSFGSQLAFFHTVLWPGRLEKIVIIDGAIPYFSSRIKIIDYVRKLYSDVVEIMKDAKEKTYRKEEIMYALQNMRHSSLTSDAANALFQRSVTKVGDDLYKYNRDRRLKSSVKPLMSLEEGLEILDKTTTPILILYATGSYKNSLGGQSILLQHGKSVMYHLVQGNHDVHNNNPEVIAPYICNYLNENVLVSKL